MKKHLRTILLVAFVVISTLCIAVGCGGEVEPIHEHQYNKQVTNSDYLSKEATCDTAAEYFYSCECGEEGTETFKSGEPLGHDYGEWISTNGKHIKICANDVKHVITEDCYGGEATCEAKAVCEACKEEYGSALQHAYGDWESDGNGNHVRTCANDSSHKEVEECSGGKATCSAKAVCETCKKEYGEKEKHAYGDWESDGNGNHVRICANDSSHKEVEECSGGQATCLAKAICENCKTEYGQIGDHNYVSDTCEYCQEERPVNGIVLKLNSSGDGYTVIKYVGENTDVKIPSEHKGKPVVAIEGAFSSTAITSVEIPNSITSLGSYAFSFCESLETVTFEKNSKLEEIPDYAFGACSSLISIEIPASVKTIASRAFNVCSKLKTVTFEEGSKLQNIEFYAFFKCSELANISLPNSLETIGESAFAYDTSLKNIIIPESVTTMAQDVFTMWTSEQTIYIEAEDIPSGWSAWWDSGCFARYELGYNG